jgi:hypothetical protein
MRLIFYSNLDHLGYLLAASSISSDGGDRSSYSQTFYLSEAVELSVAVNPDDACFLFAAGDASICLPQLQDIKDSVCLSHAH